MLTAWSGKQYCKIETMSEQYPPIVTEASNTATNEYKTNTATESAAVDVT